MAVDLSVEVKLECKAQYALVVDLLVCLLPVLPFVRATGVDSAIVEGIATITELDCHGPHFL